VTPDERAGLRQAIAKDPGNMSWPSKTVSELLDDLDTAERNLNDWRNAAYAEAQGGKARAEATDAETARLTKALADQTWHAGQAESYTAKAFDRLEVHEAARRAAEVERDQARTAANALTIFCRQAGCTDAELGAILEAYSPEKFADGLPAWLTSQRPAGNVEEWPR
jgi:hypothetical protein